MCARPWLLGLSVRGLRGGPGPGAPPGHLPSSSFTHVLAFYSPVASEWLCGAWAGGGAEGWGAAQGASPRRGGQRAHTVYVTHTCVCPACTHPTAGGQPCLRTGSGGCTGGSALLGSPPGGRERQRPPVQGDSCPPNLLPCTTLTPDPPTAPRPRCPQPRRAGDRPAWAGTSPEMWVPSQGVDLFLGCGSFPRAAVPSPGMGPFLGCQSCPGMWFPSRGVHPLLACWSLPGVSVPSQVVDPFLWSWSLPGMWIPSQCVDPFRRHPSLPGVPVLS